MGNFDFLSHDYDFQNGFLKTCFFFSHAVNKVS